MEEKWLCENAMVFLFVCRLHSDNADIIESRLLFALFSFVLPCHIDPHRALR